MVVPRAPACATAASTRRWSCGQGSSSNSSSAKRGHLITANLCIPAPSLCGLQTCIYSFHHGQTDPPACPRGVVWHSSSTPCPKEPEGTPGNENYTPNRHVRRAVPAPPAETDTRAGSFEQEDAPASRWAHLERARHLVPRAAVEHPPALGLSAVLLRRRIVRIWVFDSLPHCLKKWATPRSAQLSRTRRTQSACSGRAPAPDSPPVITQSIPATGRRAMGPIRGSTDRNFTSAAVRRRTRSAIV